MEQKKRAVDVEDLHVHRSRSLPRLVLSEIFLAFCILCACLCCYLYLNQPVLPWAVTRLFLANTLGEDEPADAKGAAPKEIRILFWTKIISFSHPEYQRPLREHPETKCIFTNEHSDLNRSHMVVFHFHDQAWYFHSDMQLVPPEHPPDQKWVYFTQESPVWDHNRRPQIAAMFGHHFNATATFRADSDIDVRYGYYYERSDGSTAPAPNYAAGRTRLAAWLVSNCDWDKTGRMQFVQELHKHIDVDIYGKCGHIIPECQSMDTTDSCLSFLKANYKFYFAFENSDCEDYITEKLWRNAYLYDMVPIVRGRRNHYARMAPPNSYIAADEFSSAKELADYLLLLDRNDTLYNAYFEWKGKYNIYVNPMTSSGASDDLSDFDHRLCKYAFDHWTLRKWYNVSAMFTEKLCDFH